MKERIFQIRKSLNLTQEEMGKTLGVTRAAISRLESGVYKVTDTMMKLICSTYNVDENWLRDGNGKMFLEAKAISLDDYARQNKISEFETDVIKLYMSLDPVFRNQFMDGLKELVKKSDTKKVISVVKSTPIAAHNDSELTDDEIALMREDLDEL